MGKDGGRKSQGSLVRDLLCHLLHDCLDHYSGSARLRKEILRDRETAVSRLSYEGISFATKCLPLLGRSFDRSLELGHFVGCPAFKRQGRKGTLPRFLGGLFSLVFHANGNVRSDADVFAIRFIRQFCYAFYKLTSAFSPEMVNKAVENFIQVDESLQRPDYSGKRLHRLEVTGMLRNGRTLIKRVLDRSDPWDILPRHGPGAVAKGEKQEQKWSFKTYYEDLHAEFPFHEFFVASRPGLFGTERISAPKVREEFGVAKLFFVPKDSRGPRTISMEPLEYQFVQQGLRRILQRVIEAHPLTAGHVNFSKQEVNGDLALSSSKDRSYATIDMKEASDRLSVWLVAELFQDLPNWVKCLMASRSPATRLPNGKDFYIRKFAPMGSAVCFPVESLCFYALCVGAIIWEHNLSLREAAHCVYVYGDDIIVPSKYYDTVTRLLPLVDLKVNEDKSFVKGLFRESCGVDAYDGELVTPIRVKDLPAEDRIDGDRLRSLVDLGNNLYLSGYFRCASYVTELAESYVGKLPHIPIGWECGYLAWQSWTCRVPNMFGAKRRYNQDLQHVEFRLSLIHI